MNVIIELLNSWASNSVISYLAGFASGWGCAWFCWKIPVAVYRHYKAKQDKKLCSALHERGDYYWDAQEKPHCPYCYLQGKAVMLAEIREDYYCPACNRTQSKELSIRAKFRMYENPSRRI